jgi:hypothetical protein
MTTITKEEIAAYFEPDDIAEFEDEKLGRLATLANQVLDFEKEISEQESTLKSLKEKKRQITEDLLPAVMTEHGLADFTLTDGRRIIVKKFYSCTPKSEETIVWIREHFPGLIKHRLHVDFGSGKDTEALELQKRLQEEGLYPSNKEWVEPSTLRGFAREQVEAGNPPPDDLFNLFIGERATIK